MAYVPPSAPDPGGYEPIEIITSYGTSARIYLIQRAAPSAGGPRGRAYAGVAVSLSYLGNARTRAGDGIHEDVNFPARRGRIILENSEFRRRRFAFDLASRKLRARSAPDMTEAMRQQAEDLSRRLVDATWAPAGTVRVLPEQQSTAREWTALAHVGSTLRAMRITPKAGALYYCVSNGRRRLAEAADIRGDGAIEWMGTTRSSFFKDGADAMAFDELLGYYQRQLPEGLYTLPAGSPIRAIRLPRQAP